MTKHARSDIHELVTNAILKMLQTAAKASQAADYLWSLQPAAVAEPRAEAAE